MGKITKISNYKIKLNEWQNFLLFLIAENHMKIDNVQLREPEKNQDFLIYIIRSFGI